ncbi:hypothetical protein SAMCFNEI73_Ch2586 [Sinorhizobium americanum]|uniref:Uncharacterized protein n=1 Tax=Sinorhizobium americanum TaxID=194963 RepID=A0A1L3LP53_9HYPH|nr:hypothetical protein SAMCFNEI73_Ch2586 [Sinorhizobium americanum]OAP47442.1 hypothetical protein ATC00_22560 [Sinorhizobium americanum]
MNFLRVVNVHQEASNGTLHDVATIGEVPWIARLAFADNGIHFFRKCRIDMYADQLCFRLHLWLLNVAMIIEI